MKTEFYRVIACDDVQTLTKQDGTQTSKRQIRLQELGGFSRYDNPQQSVSNALQATMFGNLAQCIFYPYEIVAVTLRTSLRFNQGAWYQDTTVVDIVRVQQ